MPGPKASCYHPPIAKCSAPRAISTSSARSAPLIVEGQIHGGVVQGLGQILFEHAVYDPDSGQLLTGSLMDYSVARADDVSNVAITFNEVPCTTNALGMKGCGEAGSVGSMAAAMNAVLDALAPLGVRHLEMPATPPRVWAAIAAAKAG